ncbi:E3 SUMO-protein ligase NSE2-like [Atheta coriaria]|uniref:E3 SUMO-protein ligase NSE2-like n=1 Tax=Dalotia coriaria TaxID=877792 RepID=UPI0031F423B8
MDQEEFLGSLAKQKLTILEFQQIMTSFGENSVASELESVLNELDTINTQHLRSLAALKAMPPPEAGSQEATEELFQQALENIPDKEESDSDDDEENATQSNNDSALGDRSFILSQVDYIPVDPITKNKICDPARNSVCNHVYEHDIIMDYLKQFYRKRLKKKVKCPYIGCSNKNVKAEHIIRDPELKKKFVAMMNTEEVNPNDSVISILEG